MNRAIGLSNVFIDNIMYHVSYWYKGCYASDNFPKNLNPPYSMVINLSRSDMIGTHFIVIIEQKQEIMYFDPYGLNCFVPAICNFLKSKHKKKLINLKTIQSIDSSFCGVFAMCFCYFSNSPLQ